MIVVPGAEPLKGGVMTYYHGPHTFRNSPLPYVIFTHTAGTTLLSQRDLFGMHAMNSLPRIPREICFYRLCIRCTLEHLCDRHRANPELGFLVPLEPLERRPRMIVRHFVKQIDQERGVQEALPHCLRDTRRRTSPMRLAASASTSAPVMKGSSRISMRT